MLHVFLHKLRWRYKATSSEQHSHFTWSRKYFQSINAAHP